MKRCLAAVCSLGVVVWFCSCAKPMAIATAKPQKAVSQTFANEPNEVYAAVRWALQTNGYPIETDDKQAGSLVSRWVATKIDSHYVKVFGRKDYGVTGAYHRLEANLIPEEGGTRLEMISDVQSVVSTIYSSGKEEKMILEKAADYLRDPSVAVTNLGLERHGL